MSPDSAPSDLFARTRHTRPSGALGLCRLLLGLLFASTGLMKFVVPSLREAFSGQLAAAGLPFHFLNMWMVPLVELLVGVALLAGFFSRLASLVAIGMMFVATYVHLVVDDPSLFPLQPEEPIIPLVAIAICLYVSRKGSGSWSLDLRQQATWREERRASWHE